MLAEEMNNAIGISEKIKPILNELLFNKPDYGMLEIKMHFHSGNLCRVITSREQSLLLDSNNESKKWP